jgi:hypothetical protein
MNRIFLYRVLQVHFIAKITAIGKMTEISAIISACTMHLISNNNFEGVITYVEPHSSANNLFLQLVV